MTKPWLRLSLCLFSLLQISGCLPHPDSDVSKASPELSIRGSVVHSREGLSGRTAIYVEQAQAPEALSNDDGSFALTFDAARLEQLQLKYGLQNQRLRLYLVSESTTPESTLIDTINLQYRGEMDLGEIKLQEETPITGRVVAFGSPVENARVLLGRKEVFTAVDGTFTGSIPLSTSTPILVEKSGFVQTKGSWIPGSETRDLELYSELTPNGMIEASMQPRIASNSQILLNYSSNGTARWIRFSYSADALVKVYEPESPWLELGKSLQIESSGSGVLYYQFADQDQKVLSPVFNYSLNLSPAN